MMYMETTQLPEAAATRAFRTFNGEYAWRRSDLPSVTQEIAGEHLAIVGGEVWLVEGSLFSPLSPRKDGGWAVLAWNVPEREPGETWTHYSQRSLEATLHAIRTLNPEATVAPEAADKLYYHLSFADEPGYNLWRIS